MEFGVATVVGITVICFLLGLGCKSSVSIPDEKIPVIMGCAGLVLGIVALYTGMPDFPATDPINAAAIGAASGLAATGIHQAWKQSQKEKED